MYGNRLHFVERTQVIGIAPPGGCTGTILTYFPVQYLPAQNPIRLSAALAKALRD
jgi:hypothetical protein